MALLAAADELPEETVLLIFELVAVVVGVETTGVEAAVELTAGAVYSSVLFSVVALGVDTVATTCATAEAACC